MSPTLRYTLALSVFFHALWAAYFFATRSTSTSEQKTGTITVDFVQPFEHSPAEAAPEAEVASTKKLKTASRPAQQAVPQSPMQKGDSDSYIAEVTKLIHARKIYPRAALDREEEGRVVVGVSVNRSGQILNSEIEVPSPFSSLNQAALETIKSIGQFPPLPASVPEPMHLHIPLQFKIGRSGG